MEVKKYLCSLPVFFLTYVVAFCLSLFLSSAVRGSYIGLRDYIEQAGHKNIIVDKYCFSAPANLTTFFHTWKFEVPGSFVIALPITAIYFFLALSKRNVSPPINFLICTTLSFFYGMLFAYTNEKSATWFAYIEKGLAVVMIAVFTMGLHTGFIYIVRVVRKKSST